MQSIEINAHISLVTIQRRTKTVIQAGNLTLSLAAVLILLFRAVKIPGFYCTCEWSLKKEKKVKVLLVKFLFIRK